MGSNIVDWEKLISLKNIFSSWTEFVRGKQHKRDVMIFVANLENELWALCNDLSDGSYQIGGYQKFLVHDPKIRIIHKATVRDRVVHRLLYNYLLPIFNDRWLDCSFSCRPGFGQHLSVKAVERALAKVSGNYTRLSWAVKCDVKKFFDSIDHSILYHLLCRRVHDERVRRLLFKIIESYHATPSRGIPIGNLTSQIFANVYLHELDWYVKHTLKKHYYYRYADDFVCLTASENEAVQFLNEAGEFLRDKLSLTLHPHKITIRPNHWGIDWLGQVLLPDYKVLRPSTRRRMLKKIGSASRQNISSNALKGMIASYKGLLKSVAKKTIVQRANQLLGLYRLM